MNNAAAKGTYRGRSLVRQAAKNAEYMTGRIPIVYPAFFAIGSASFTAGRRLALALRPHDG